MEADKDKGKSKKQSSAQDHESVPASPVCYANSDEVRAEFKEEMPSKEKKEDDRRK